MGIKLLFFQIFAEKFFLLREYPPLAERAKANLQSGWHKNYLIRCADGSLGWPTFKKFDAIICSAVSNNVPEPLIKQLNVSGKLICPIGNEKKKFSVN